MTAIKLCIADPATGKTYQKDSEEAAKALLGLNLGNNLNGELIGLSGFEFQITGGSDYCGFPMRSGILGVRKKVTLLGGVGYRSLGSGIKQRKTVCGHKIHERISQVNLKMVKGDSAKLADVLGKKSEAAEPAQQSAGAAA